MDKVLQDLIAKFKTDLDFTEASLQKITKDVLIAQEGFVYPSKEIIAGKYVFSLNKAFYNVKINESIITISIVFINISSIQIGRSFLSMTLCNDAFNRAEALIKQHFEITE